jgi:prepilin-type N-terminal cleavage/methylation domain-containing protein
MTLTEMLVAIALGSIVMSAVAALSAYTAHSFAALANYGDLDRRSRNALDQMTWKIREVDGVVAYGTNWVTFRTQGTNTLAYIYFPSSRRLIEFEGARRTVLLTECDTLRFDIFSRNPVEGTFDQFPIALDTTAAKLVRVSWTCSRQILGKKVNTESVQSAKIVIRKQ